MAVSTNASTFSVAKQRCVARYHAARAVVLVYAGFNVGPLTIDLPSDGGIPGRSNPIHNRIPPIFTAADGRQWWIEERIVSFAAVVRMAEYAGRFAMGRHAPPSAVAIPGLSDAERALADDLLACRDTHITTLARALSRAGTLDHASVIDLISPLGSCKPPRH